MSHRIIVFAVGLLVLVFGGCAPVSQHLLISQGVFTIDHRTNRYTVTLQSKEFAGKYTGTELECDVDDPLTGDEFAERGSCPMPAAGVIVSIYQTKTEEGFPYTAFEYAYAANGRYRVEPEIPSDNWQK